MTNEPVLVVESGFQAGARVSLARGENRVGSDPDCAVVVVDPALEDGNFRVTVDDAVRIQSDSRIVLADGTIVLPGRIFEVPVTCSFLLGGTTFRLELPDRGAYANAGDRFARTGRFSSLWPLAAGIATLGGAALIAAMLVGAATSPEIPTAASPSRPSRASAPAVEIAAGFLRQRLESSGLNGLVVITQADGAVIVSGTLPAARQREWTPIRRQYDQRFGASRVLMERFDAPASVPSLHIAAVWLGPNPYVVDDHGERLGPGASLGDGWSIAKIDPDDVIVQQGTRSVALRY